jgi:hypothetical protein
LLRSFAGRAINVASKTASDVIDGRRPIKEAIVGNTLDEVKAAFRKREHSINKEGEGANDIFSSSPKKRKKHNAATALH